MAENNKKIGVLIVAGGSGSRFGSEKPKQYVELGGKPIIEHTIKAFLGIADHVQVVIRHEDIEEYSKISKNFPENSLLPAVFGAAKRQGSVKNGLIALEKHGVDIVLIHDAARPFISPALIREIIQKTIEYGAAIPAVAVKDTLKLNKRGVIEKTVSRKNLYGAQTPQGFEFEKILYAHKKLQDFDYTDDASLFEAIGEKVALVEGDENNFKITTKADLQMAENILNENTSGNKLRIGHGFDVHQFEPGDGVILGGIKIPHDKKLKGHSDADAVLHAITDAVLGAAAAGDIGDHFPPSDDKWKGADSVIFMKEALRIASEKGLKLNNVDVTILAEEPKIGPHKAAMKKKLAEILSLNENQVNVKATTTEKLGFVGRSEGLAAEAVVLMG